jgi:hypothetical protein
MNKSQLAKKLGVSRTYITLLTQGKRQASPALANKLSQLGVGNLGQLSGKLSQLNGNLGQQEVDASYAVSVDHSGLQTRWGALSVSGEFDTHPLPRGDGQCPQTSTDTLVMEFLKSRRQGLSPRSIEYYRRYLKLAEQVVGVNTTGQKVPKFIGSLQCTIGS